MGSKGNRVLPWLPCHPFRLWTWFRMSQTADHQDKIYQWALHHLTLGGCQRDLKSKQESVILVSRSEQPPRETSPGTCQPLCTRLIQLNSAIWPALMRKEVNRSMEPTHTENQLQEDIPYIFLLTLPAKWMFASIRAQPYPCHKIYWSCLQSAVKLSSPLPLLLMILNLKDATEKSE